MTKFEEIPFLLKLGQVVDFNEYNYSPEDLVKSGKIEIKTVPVKTFSHASRDYPSVRVSYILDEDVEFVYNTRTYKKDAVILTSIMDIRMSWVI